MKKTSILVIACAIFMMAMMGVSCAASGDWTDFEGATYVWTDYTATDHTTANLQIQNIEKKEGHTLYVHISNNANESVTLDGSQIPTAGETWKVVSEDNKISNLDLTPYVEKSGDIYIWIAEADVSARKAEIVVEKESIDRLPQLPLGKRIFSSFLEDGTQFNVKEPHSAGRSLTFKVGSITDNALLQALKTNQSTAADSLLTYAKSNAATFTGTATVEAAHRESVTAGKNLQNGAYYFAYVALDDNSGTYYPVEDVYLVQAYAAGNGFRLIYPSDEHFTWGSDETDIFADCTHAQAFVHELEINWENIWQSKVTLKINHIVANPNKHHQFWFCISTQTGNIPSYEDAKWIKAESFTIDETTGTCEIITNNLLDVAYIRAFATSGAETAYISLYEVVDDEEIIADRIQGNYKLILADKEIALEEETEEPGLGDVPPAEEGGDTTVAPDDIPQTGQNVAIAVAVLTFLVLAIFGAIQYKKYNYKA